MKLSEALAERAEINNRVSLLERRLNWCVRIQEGTDPAEDPQALIKELDILLARREQLVCAINATNTATAFGEGNLTDALAHRDYLLAARRLYNDLAEKASSNQDRYSLSEIRVIPTVDVKKLRKKADKYSKQYRELDTEIQRVNWATKLIGLED